MHCTVYTRVCGSCWGNQVSFPCLEGLVHFNEAQTGILIFLSPILASESNPPVFFPQSPSWLYGPGLYLVLRKIRNVHRWALPPSLLVFMAGQFLHKHMVERTCASESGVLIPSLIMTYYIALNKTFNLTYKMGTTIIPQGPMVRNKGHIYRKMLCKLQRAIEIVTNFNVI